MENMTFKKQKLNKEDHKKVDDTAKNVRKGLGVAGTIAMVATFAVNDIPKVIKTVTKL